MQQLVTDYHGNQLIDINYLITESEFITVKSQTVVNTEGRGLRFSHKDQIKWSRLLTCSLYGTNNTNKNFFAVE